MAWSGDNWGHSMAQRKRRRAKGIVNDPWEDRGRKSDAQDYIDRTD